MGLVLLAGALGACAQEPAGDQWLGEAACVAGQCVVTSDERRVQMTLPETVPAMKSFALALQLDGFAAVRDVVVDFGMAEMDMGQNRYRLEAVDSGRWHGQAILPVCLSGRSDWQADVAITTAGGVYRARFGFVVGRGE